MWNCHYCKSLDKIHCRDSVTTTLLTLAVALASILAFRILPTSPLPQVDFPTISVGANGRRIATATRATLRLRYYGGSRFGLHTIRGFVAGTVNKAGYAVESFKPEGGERSYQIKK